MTEGCNSATVGRAAAYTAYNVGGGVLVGLARIIVAIAYLAKHAFYTSIYENSRRQHAEESRKPSGNGGFVSSAKQLKETMKRKADESLLDKAGRALSELTSGAESGLNRIGEKVYDATIGKIEPKVVKNLSDECKKAWLDQLGRGFAELVYFGAPVYTYLDNTKTNDSKIFGFTVHDGRPSILGIKEVVQLIGKEHKLDAVIQGFVGKANYDPLF